MLAEKIGKKWTTALCCIFIAIELIIYFLEIFTKNVLIKSNILEYSSTILCFLFALLFIQKNKASIFVVIALFITVFSDLILILLYSYSTFHIGITIFIFAQIFYMLRVHLLLSKKWEKNLHIILNIVVIIIAEIVTYIIFKEEFTYLFAVTIIYFSTLAINTLFALIHFKQNPLLAIGLLLFALCDLFLGLDFLYIFPNLYDIADWSWICYLPSQVIIVLSNIKNKAATNNQTSRVVS